MLFCDERQSSGTNRSSRCLFPKDMDGVLFRMSDFPSDKMNRGQEQPLSGEMNHATLPDQNHAPAHQTAHLAQNPRCAGDQARPVARRMADRDGLDELASAPV